jgi:hypothetical protein
MAVVETLFALAVPESVTPDVETVEPIVTAAGVEPVVNVPDVSEIGLPPSSVLAAIIS